MWVAVYINNEWSKTTGNLAKTSATSPLIGPRPYFRILKSQYGVQTSGALQKSCTWSYTMRQIQNIKTSLQLLKFEFSSHVIGGACFVRLQYWHARKPFGWAFIMFLGIECISQENVTGINISKAPSQYIL